MSFDIQMTLFSLKTFETASCVENMHKSSENHSISFCHHSVSFNFVYAGELKETNELVVYVISPNGNLMGLVQAT